MFGPQEYLMRRIDVDGFYLVETTELRKCLMKLKKMAEERCDGCWGKLMNMNGDEHGLERWMKRSLFEMGRISEIYVLEHL